MLAICHSHYSLQTGVTSPKAWARAAAERGYTALVLADVDGLYGAVEFAKAAREHGLRPIVGALLEWMPGRYYTVLARSEEGYRQLCRLLTARHTWPEYRFQEAVAQGGLDGLLFLTRAPEVLAGLAEVVPTGSLYALAPGKSTPEARQPLLWGALPTRVPAAFIPDAWFLEESDREAFDCLRRLRQGSGRHARLGADHPDAVLPLARDWQRWHPDSHGAEAVEAACAFEFTFGRVLLPRLALPAGATAEQHLRSLCREGIERRYPPGSRRRREADERLEKEFQVVVHNGFADYFLYVDEIVRFAREREIPYGVRGSAASCLISYLLEFTHCCPLEHTLYFERFMNPGRRDCPDIDLDLADNRRDEVIDFCYRRWGSEHVAMVATVQFYRARGALRDAARLLGISPERCRRLEEGTESSPELYRIAALLIGKPRHLGVHCGGLLITPCPITDATPLVRAAKGILTSHFEKDQAEAIGLVKMDLLGNSALTVIDEACAWLAAGGLELREPGPAYDYKVRRLFATGDTLGVYQCESPGMRQLCRAMAPANPKETAAAISLIRPGPAAAGMKDAFIRRRRGLEPVTYLHPAMAEFLADTWGVMLYQEDVMKVAVHLAGYTMADADRLRRAVSKDRAGDTFQQERHRFVFRKSSAAGIPAAQAEAIWDAVSRFASYSYCKAHATVYARLAWLTARLKAHHPREFYAAVLNSHKSMYPPRVFAWDALRHGIPVLPPDINRSQRRWSPTPHGLLAGLGSVRGLSRRTVATLLAERTAQGPFRDLRELLCRVAFQTNEAEALVLVGACSGWGRREELYSELNACAGHGRQQALFHSPSPEQLPPLALAQLALTGIPFGIHPTERLPWDGLCHAVDMPRFVRHNVAMIGLLDAVKQTPVEGQNGAAERLMSFATFEDATGLYDAVLFPDTHQRLGGLFSHAGPYRLYGQVIEQWGTFSLDLREAEAM
jgi:DNA-directed DNA polymerase III PolC